MQFLIIAMSNKWVYLKECLQISLFDIKSSGIFYCHVDTSSKKFSKELRTFSKEQCRIVKEFSEMKLKTAIKRFDLQTNIMQKRLKMSLVK